MQSKKLNAFLGFGSFEGYVSGLTRKQIFKKEKKNGAKINIMIHNSYSPIQTNLTKWCVLYIYSYSLPSLLSSFTFSDAMSPLMKSSSHFIFFIICFSSLSIDPRADNVDPHLINVPLPPFKNSLEKTKELVQNVASTMSHMHAGEDLLDGNSTVLVISYCEDLLDETAEVLDWSLSTIDDLKADVVSHMRTWLNTSQSREMTCVDAFQNSIDSNVAESLRQVTKSIDEVLGMIQVEQQHHLHRHNATAAPGPDPDPYDLALSRTADVTVSQDGSGKFKRIMDAIAAAPSHSQKQFVIFVKKGVYKEYVTIDKTKTNLVLIGEGMSVTTISGDRSNASGWATMDSATFGKTPKLLLFSSFF